MATDQQMRKRTAFEIRVKSRGRVAGTSFSAASMLTASSDFLKTRPVKIRPYDAKDGVPLANLYGRSVQRIGSRHYSSLQVEAWLSLRPSPERIHQLTADGRIRLVAVDGSDRPVAFADLENDGHIGFLYCSPEAAGKGVASALYDELERIARERGMTRLYSEASEAARRLFLQKGFTVIARRQFEISGVEIHNYAMEKALGNEETG
jgi:putative acetyltransferase